MDKYLQNLIDQGANPHLIAKHAGIGVAEVQTTQAPADTHGSEPRPVSRRRGRKKAAE